MSYAKLVPVIRRESCIHQERSSRTQIWRASKRAPQRRYCGGAVDVLESDCILVVFRHGITLYSCS
jgi:hypothetical protein